MPLALVPALPRRVGRNRRKDHARACANLPCDWAAAACRALEAERERLQQRLSESARAASSPASGLEGSAVQAHVQPLEAGSAAVPGSLHALRQELKDLRSQLQASRRCAWVPFHLVMPSFCGGCFEQRVCSLPMPRLTATG